MEKSSIKIWQALLVGLLIVILMTLQSSSIYDGQLAIKGNGTILLLINYTLWALLINIIHKSFMSVEWKGLSILTKLLPRFIGLLIFQLFISNLLFSLYKLSVGGIPLNESLDVLINVLPKALASRAIDLLVITGILKIIDTQRRLNSQKLELSQVKNQLTQSKLDALQMQLNPHFLFNALHAIHSLIGHDNQKSRKMLLEISQLLRKILELGNQQLISLEEELELFKTYLAIEEERFHDRLKVVYEIDSGAKDTLVPSLLLQPLLENALKHGISLMEGKGEINLKVELSPNHMNITLGNTYDPNISATESTGIGLKNVQERLETLFPNEFELVIKGELNWFCVKISIPRHDI